MSKIIDEMNLIIELINVCLTGKWTQKQYSEGMMFEVLQSWKPFYKNLLDNYREAGWTLKTQIEMIPGERTIWLVFRHPTKDEKNEKKCHNYD